jgi:carbon starvation protein
MPVVAPAVGFVVAQAPWYTNSLVLTAVAVVWLVLAYRWYGRRLERRIVGPTDAKTPAEAQYDGVDYCPARPVVLFGHHFASIAGAGPILGPIFAAAAFGWGPTALWVLLGVVLIGAVHDYLALMVSVRNKGLSLPDVARETVGSSARVFFLIFVWIGLVLVITSFTRVTADTLRSDPQIVIPTFGLMLLAVLFGFLTYRVKLATWIGTAIALGLLLFAMWVGFRCPVRLEQLGVPESWVGSVWVLVLLLYCVVASVLPVWILLQPRDYLSTWILIVGTSLGLAGIVWVHPTMKAPAFTAAVAAPGPIWPMIFILVACGAVSGFHCLVAGGTTSKQLAKERHGLPIGYGGMLTEGLVAIVALVAGCAGIYYVATDAPTQEHAGRALLTLLRDHKGSEGQILAFGWGYNTLTEPFLGPLGSAMGVQNLGKIIGIIMVNGFVLTSLDTAARLARFISTELVGERVPLLRNRIVASLAPVVPAGILIFHAGAFDKIWPIFGAANQLIAAFALMVITGYLMKRKKPTRYTVVPAVFMLVTTMAALIWQAYQNLLGAKEPNYVLGLTALILLALGVMMAVLGRRALLGIQPHEPPRS